MKEWIFSYITNVLHFVLEYRYSTLVCDFIH